MYNSHLSIDGYLSNKTDAAFSSMCAMSRRPVSEVVSPASLPYTLPVVRRTMLEVIYVARAWGITEEQLPLKTVDDSEYQYLVLGRALKKGYSSWRADVSPALQPSR